MHFLLNNWGHESDFDDGCLPRDPNVRCCILHHNLRNHRQRQRSGNLEDSRARKQDRLVKVSPKHSVKIS